jgi:hypothetical protein
VWIGSCVSAGEEREQLVLAGSRERETARTFHSKSTYRGEHEVVDLR